MAKRKEKFKVGDRVEYHAFGVVENVSGHRIVVMLSNGMVWYFVDTELTKISR